MGKRIGLLVIGVALLCAPVMASAASEWASGATYSDQVGGKLKYGLVNTLLGWTSLFSTPYEATQAGDNLFVGLGQGLWNGVGQTIGGVLHLVTFPITQIDVPLPEGGVSFGS